MIKLNFNNDNSSAEEEESLTELLLSLVFKVFIWKVFNEETVMSSYTWEGMRRKHTSMYLSCSVKRL